MLPRARGAVASGLVTLRDGDYFGPVVNLAARLVHLADPGHVVAPVGAADTFDPGTYEVTPAGTHTVRGFGDPIAIVTVTGRGEPRDGTGYELFFFAFVVAVVAGGAVTGGAGGATTWVWSPNAASSTHVRPGASLIGLPAASV